MEKQMSKIKSIFIMLAIIVIIIGGIVVYTIGFNVGLAYSYSQNITIYLDNSYDKNDIKQIADEVFEKVPKMIQEVESFNDAVAITVKEPTDEQINNLKQKISEKYGIEDIDNHITITYMPSYRLRDVIKPYILPLAITTIAIFIYIMIRFRKIGIKNTLLKPLGLLILFEALLMSIIAIFRIPLGRLVIPIGLLIYIATFVYILAKLAKIEEVEKPNTKSKKKQI